MEDLRTDDAVEGVGGDVVRLGEVGDDRGGRMRVVQVEDVQLRNRCPAVPVGVGVVSKLEAVSANIRAELLEELLQVVAMERLAAIEPPDVAEWLDVEAETQPRARCPGQCRRPLDRSPCRVRKDGLRGLSQEPHR